MAFSFICDCVDKKEHIKMNDLFKQFDSLIASLGASSPTTLIIYKLLATLFFTVFFWFVFLGIISLVEKKLRKTKLNKYSSKLLIPAKDLLKYIILLVSGTYIIRILNIRVIENIFYAIVLLIITKPLIDVIKTALTFLEENIAAKTTTNIDDILFDLLNRFAAIIVGTTMAVVALDILGINIMPFIAGAGIIGVAIGFAAKDTLSNIIAGVLLIIDRPFEIGDRIEVWGTPSNTASWGDVTEIGLRATKIRTTDNIIVIIPNNEIMTRDIVNYTTLNSSIRVRINVGVAYDSDIKKAKEVIKAIALEPDWTMNSPEPVVIVKNFGDSSIDLQLRVWIKDARKRIATISYVTDNIKEAFDKNGIEIPYPKRDITIINKTDT
jgi:MscS family membrane protein